MLCSLDSRSVPGGVCPSEYGFRPPRLLNECLDCREFAFIEGLNLVCRFQVEPELRRSSERAGEEPGHLDGNGAAPVDDVRDCGLRLVDRLGEAILRDTQGLKELLE